jgi:hypothetical protein
MNAEEELAPAELPPEKKEVMSEPSAKSRRFNSKLPLRTARSLVPASCKVPPMSQLMPCG